MTVHIHTDGSCHGNPGPGGWAAIILTGSPDNYYTVRGGEPETTNNRMEMAAAIAGLNVLQNMPWTHGGQVVIHTDSKYVCDAFLKNWVSNWQKNGWRNAQRKPVANQDLWDQLLPLVQQRQPRWEWVKGHSGDHWNELCDQIANEEADKQEAKLSADPAADAAADAEAADEAAYRAENESADQAADGEENGPDEFPGAYNRGWQDGYETACRELMQVLEGMGAKP